MRKKCSSPPIQHSFHTSLLLYPKFPLHSFIYVAITPNSLEEDFEARGVFLVPKASVIKHFDIGASTAYIYEDFLVPFIQYEDKLVRAQRGKVSCSMSHSRFGWLQNSCSYLLLPPVYLSPHLTGRWVMVSGTKLKVASIVLLSGSGCICWVVSWVAWRRGSEASSGRKVGMQSLRNEPECSYPNPRVPC